MKVEKRIIEIPESNNQLKLFGYEKYFNSFIKLHEKNKIPNCILLSGPKGIGKSTFAYHFINYLFSKNEDKLYSVNDFTINKENLSYKLLIQNIHPNFFLIENNLLQNEIKIEKVRKLMLFLNKSTFSRDLKLILIDNAEFLNLSASNALLKALEEPPENTYFFIIHDNTSVVLDTIRSRCCEFKIFFSNLEKKKIFYKILKEYPDKFYNNILNDVYFSDTPGNLLKYFFELEDANININSNKILCILFFMEKYKKSKNSDSLYFLKLFIEFFYIDLLINSNKNINSFFFNYSKILKKIEEMKKFNLDEKNTFIMIKDILNNEKK